jgi:hypothetical protein
MREIYLVPAWVSWTLRAYYQGVVDTRRRGLAMAAVGLVVGFVAGVAL